MVKSHNRGISDFGFGRSMTGSLEYDVASEQEIILF
jgi:hypothetical protein